MGGAVADASGEFTLPVALEQGAWRFVASYGGGLDIWPTDAAMALTVQ